MKKIAILASGTGSNAENIAKYFANSQLAKVEILLHDREQAPVVEKMKALGIETSFFPRSEWKTDCSKIVGLLEAHGIDLIVLAGFTSIIGNEIIEAFNGKIINIHPSLLPKFGGKGMWGDNVHRAVIEAGETESGITIHYVTPEIDGGGIIAQFRCPVEPGDTPETLATRIHRLEHLNFPPTIETLLHQNH